jgi:hypothetical protein
MNGNTWVKFALVKRVLGAKKYPQVDLNKKPRGILWSFNSLPF